MRIECGTYVESLREAGEHARRAELEGFDTWWAAETKTDAFLSAAIAAHETKAITVGTGIAVALARNPMTVAVQANDLQLRLDPGLPKGPRTSWLGRGRRGAHPSDQGRRLGQAARRDRR